MTLATSTKVLLDGQSLGIRYTSGLEAFQDYLKTLTPKGNSKEIWFKHGHGAFYVGDWNGNGEFPLWATRKTGEGAETRIRTHKVTENAYTYLRSLSEMPLEPNADGDVPSGGIFTIPTQPQGYPGKGAIDSTDDLGCEMDNGSKDEQIAIWKRFTSVTGLRPSTLLSSGGKSIHAHFKLDRHYPREEADYPRRLLCLGMIGDAAVSNVHQPMRIPGFRRSDKGTEQELLFSSDSRYTLDEVVAGLRAWFKAEGMPFPERITDEWWIHLKRSLKTAEKGNRQPQMDALSEGIDEWGRKLNEVREASQQRKLNASLDSTNLIDAVKQTCDRSGEQAFNLRNHGWIGTSKHRRGNCTFHESTSGSAWLSQSADGRWLFNCQTCGKGLDYFRYWLADRLGSVPTSYPKGKEWAALSKEFLTFHGVTYADDWTPSKPDQNLSEPECDEWQPDPNWGEPDRELYEAHQSRTEEEWQNLQIEARNEKLKGFPLVKWNPESLARVREVQSKIKNFDVVEQEQRAARQWERYLKVSEQWKPYQRNFKLSVKDSDRYTVERYDGYAPIFLPKQRTIIIRGGLGSGKTQAMLKSLLLAEWRDRCVVIVTPTNLLAEQVIARAKELGIEAMAYQGDVIEARKRLDANTPGIITMCPDSFKSYSTGDADWSKKALFIDEFSSVRTDILDKSLPLPHVARAINQAGFLVAADAFTADADVSAIENSFGRVRDSIFYIQNEKKDSTPVKVVQTLTKDGQISGTHEGAYLNLVAQAIVKRAKKIANGEKSKPIYICSNSLTTLQTLRIWIKANYPDLKIARVSSLDVETNHGFIRNPDEKLVTEGIDILMSSPSMQSGCDIQTPFSSVIGIYAGGKGASPTKLIQHIKRVRNADEIWISAQTNNFEDAEAADLDRRNRKRLTKQAKNLFQKAGIEVPDGFHKLGVWQEQIERLESQYSAELIQAVLCETFENVEFEYVEGGQTTLYRELRDEVKTENALETLTANRYKGRELIDTKKSPSRNQHIWDIDLAKLHKQFPTFIDDLTEDVKMTIAAKESGNYTQAMQALHRDCLDQGKILISGKLEKLKNHAIATSTAIKEHLESMTEALALSYPTLHSKRFKRYRDVKLYNELGLESLAQLKKKTDPEAEVGELGGGVELIEGETIFGSESPKVVELYTKFLVSESLNLYPEVTTIDQFWRAVCSSMRACGHQQLAHEVRVESDQARPNGNFRGRARETYSKKQRFSGFYRIEESGSGVFRKHFDKLMFEVEALVDRELETHRKWKEKRKRTQESQPDWGDVAA